MNKIKQIITTAVIIFILTIIGFWSTITAQESDVEKKTDLQKQIEEYENKLSETRTQKNTLSSQIEYMDTQIYLTNLQMNQTEEDIIGTENEINVLGTRITNLDTSLNSLSETLIGRIAAGYKNRSASLFDILLDSSNAHKFVNRLKYYQLARERNRKVLLQVQEAKSNFEEQMDLRERKVEELDALKTQLQSQDVDLKNQQEAKQNLLAVTQNDEQTYQKLLTQLRAEYAAIQGIVSGAGTESEIGEVSSGAAIASIIPGASCNSSGGHLHFIVKENDSVTDPFKFLKSIDYLNCSGSNCGSEDGDAFNPIGDWNWPISPQIKMNQGYGNTWAVRNTYVGNIYSSHNGIDITGSSYTVTAVSDGTLYKGSYSGSGGCALPYVKLMHKDSNITTLYLHVYAT